MHSHRDDLLSPVTVMPLSHLRNTRHPLLTFNSLSISHFPTGERDSEPLRGAGLFTAALVRSEPRLQKSSFMAEAVWPGLWSQTGIREHGDLGQIFNL